MSKLTYRTVEATDCDMLFDWSNDPTTRQNSFSTNEISYPEHVAWFNKNLSNNILIFLDQNGVPVGIVRLNFKDQEWVISINVAPNQRGKGYSSKMISLSVENFLTKNVDINSIWAYIKKTNEISRKSFINAGFKDHSILNTFGIDSYKMIYTR